MSEELFRIFNSPDLNTRFEEIVRTCTGDAYNTIDRTRFRPIKELIALTKYNEQHLFEEIMGMFMNIYNFIHININNIDPQYKHFSIDTVDINRFNDVHTQVMEFAKLIRWHTNDITKCDSLCASSKHNALIRMLLQKGITYKDMVDEIDKSDSTISYLFPQYAVTNMFREPTRVELSVEHTDVMNDINNKHGKLMMNYLDTVTNTLYNKSVQLYNDTKAKHATNITERAKRDYDRLKRERVALGPRMNAANNAVNKRKDELIKACDEYDNASNKLLPLYNNRNALQQRLQVINNELDKLNADISDEDIKHDNMMNHTGDHAEYFDAIAKRDDVLNSEEYIKLQSELFDINKLIDIEENNINILKQRVDESKELLKQAKDEESVITSEYKQKYNDIVFIDNHYPLYDLSKYEVTYNEDDLRNYFIGRFAGGNKINDIIFEYVRETTGSFKVVSSEIVIYAYICLLITKYKLSLLNRVGYGYSVHALMDILFARHIPTHLRKLFHALYMITRTKWLPKHYLFMIRESKDESCKLGNCYWHAIANACLFNKINPECPFSFLFREINNINPNYEHDIFTDDVTKYDYFQTLSFIAGIFTEETYDFHRKYPSINDDLKFYEQNKACIQKCLYPNDSFVAAYFGYINNSDTPFSPALIVAAQEVSKIILSYSDPKIVSSTIRRFRTPGKCIFDNAIIDKFEYSDGHAQCVSIDNVDENSIWSMLNQNRVEHEDITSEDFAYKSLSMNINITPMLYDAVNEYMYYNSMLYTLENLIDKYYNIYLNHEIKDTLIEDLKDHGYNVTTKSSAWDDIESLYFYDIADAFDMDAYKQQILDNIKISKQTYSANIDREYSILGYAPVNIDSIMYVHDPNYVAMKNNYPKYTKRIITSPSHKLFSSAANAARDVILYNTNNQNQTDDDMVFITYDFVTYNIPATYLNLIDPFGSSDEPSYEIKLFSDDGEGSKPKYDSLYDMAIERIENKIHMYNNDVVKRNYYVTQLLIIKDFIDRVHLVGSFKPDAIIKKYEPLAEHIIKFDTKKLGGGNARISIFTKILIYIASAIIVTIIVCIVICFMRYGLLGTRYPANVK